jgi:hypothetical protein
MNFLQSGVEDERMSVPLAHEWSGMCRVALLRSDEQEWFACRSDRELWNHSVIKLPPLMAFPDPANDIIIPLRNTSFVGAAPQPPADSSWGIVYTIFTVA